MTYRPTLDEIYILMLSIFAKRATCSRRQVACILVDSMGRMLATGYNGVPRGFTHCTDTPCPGATDSHGDNRNCEAVHAEQNAILQCKDLDKVFTAYCSCTPCFECAKMLANLPALRIVRVAEEYADTRGKEILLRADIRVIDESNDIIPREDDISY
jgi:dCMP deaminase